MKTDPSVANGKRIALFISSYRAGGGEKQMIEIANSLALRGHVVDLLVVKPVGQYAHHVSPGVRTLSLDAGRIIFSLPKLMRYLIREKPGALLALDEHTHLLALTARALTRSRTRIYLRISNMLSELAKRYRGKSALMPFMIRRFYRHADGVVANSHGVADEVIALTRIAPERVTVIHNPKDIEGIERAAKEPVEHAWLRDTGLPTVVAVGRLREQKNFPLILAAFARVRKEAPARLIIVGAGRDEASLRAKANELSLDDAVFFAGYQDNPYAWLGKADLYVSASLWEGLPNSLLEAMICGLPVIAADCSSGPREILAPDTDYRFRLSTGLERARHGILTAVGDEDALVEALRLMLGDAAMRAAYAREAKARSADFDAPRSIDAYERLLTV